MYYAAIATGTTSFPAPVIGWDYDRQKTVNNADGTQQVTTEPPPADPRFTLLPLPDKDAAWWNNADRWQQSWQVDEKGNLTAAPPPVVPLKEQAAAAMQQVQQQAAMAAAMGGTFGPVMQAYVRALRAILNGTDTTSTTLPAAPADPTT